MAIDDGTPLIDWSDFTSGAFSDLVRDYDDPGAQQAMLIEATRIAEDMTGRRLTPFVGLVETHQAYGIDPDETAASGNVPLDLPAALGRSRAMSLGTSDSLVRRMHLDQYAGRYPEMWSYSDVSIRVFRTYGDVQVLTGRALMGPNADSGLIWFRLGEFIPIESEFEVTYSGGYTRTPADLRRAVKYLCAEIAVNELDPLRQKGQDPDQLREAAAQILVSYLKE